MLMRSRIDLHYISFILYIRYSFTHKFIYIHILSLYYLNNININKLIIVNLFVIYEIECNICTTNNDKF